MEITINKKEEFEVIPSIFKNEDNPPKFIFATPDTAQFMTVLMTGNVSEILPLCFVRFVNKPVIKDYYGKEYSYTDYNELLRLGASPVISDIHIECLQAMTDKIKEIRKKAEAVEKKSVSDGKSTKQEN